MEQEEDIVDSVFVTKTVKKVPSIEALNSEMPGKNLQKERGRKMLKTLLNRLRLRKSASVTISLPDPTYRVAYLGNVVTGWAKGRFPLSLTCNTNKSNGNGPIVPLLLS
ncbi:hypothetical protein TcasGA2_TC014504 [Tribolium castaneum]|uniref:Uncharacterized protein n=1 Tax=Tribolium castaneum TaxID=7070 RepID=D6WMC0_TRICA|nr:PREDICTED: uncharacterized protein LOC107398017 [Tribolium castaneum]XP_015836103.1 PREDICTED: uncharacterized protein LOC107398017 [Tribolium castaneum]XP_015836104.1 PREDICTED: uncharacterized protein LOC107398017 [Tribolium castaneum]XP_015836105.1 PREDICTED: uncharacterized protein LOC107398017 [Tribolium castaneum]XP_015836106.1 PREDICTED: uncharacterized protein LOC107398017 [Tribolium castaneum]XP_015836107.1 PREDICTED: uncharacterized protein LOC107398017 [Tribolium castaneum]EFA04|eukprot:XP_015836102.1 PREDICTED: uncharacterized protein LOC107398017 [Tribolium castaneum]